MADSNFGEPWLDSLGVGFREKRANACVNAMEGVEDPEKLMKLVVALVLGLEAERITRFGITTETATKISLLRSLLPTKGDG